jgi:hypothetical protein
MIISFNTGKINTNNSGGLLQQKRVEVTGNGLDVVVPDAGYDGLSTVYIKTDVGDGSSSYKDFSVIGYDVETSIMLNNEIDDDIAYSKSLYDAWNPENTSAYQLYQGDTKLVYAPAIGTSKVTSMYGMLSGCTNLEYMPEYDTTNVADYEYFCADCNKLKRVPKLSMKHLPKEPFVDMLYKGYKMFYNCSSIVTMGGFVDCEHIIWGSNSYQPFSKKYALENILEMGTIKYSIMLNNSSKLTVDSLMVVINALYDFIGKGESIGERSGKLTLGSTNLAKLTDEQKAIATAKGWTLA